MRVKPRVPVFLLVLAIGALLTAAQDAPRQPARVKITAEQANLREKPDIGSSIVQQIPEGTVLDADRKEGEWYYVRYALEDGGVIGGWIHESLVEVVEALRPEAERAARPADRAAAPPRDRTRQPGRLPRIKAPEFRTGSLPIEFAVSAGLSTLAPRDLNDGMRGFAGWRAAAIGATAAGVPRALYLAPLAGFELTYRLSPRLAIGVGADYLRGAGGDETPLVIELMSETAVTKASVRAVPVKIVARYYPRAGLYVRGALGLYAAKAGYLLRSEGAAGWVQQKGSATAAGLGGEAACGGEWDIGPRTIFFAELGLRAARFSGLTGRATSSSSDGPLATEAGRLYAFGQTGADDAVYRLVAVREAAPSGEGVVDARPARVDITGAALRVGVRFRF